ncbi:hypothetical protein DVR09_15480 (plasmid) [Erythrobacter aureus]|uniref:Uncharacterized protein n=1 Tax=Erythrobacter aureus TaxID=2182384 RepID=A0A345YIV2_9SPHN|nr:hypothetical protein DVR09_15480 [Erythrobacter aureus]
MQTRAVGLREGTLCAPGIMLTLEGSSVAVVGLGEAKNPVFSYLFAVECEGPAVRGTCYDEEALLTGDRETAACGAAVSLV